VQEPEKSAEFYFSPRAGVQAVGRDDAEVPFHGVCQCPRHSKIALAARDVGPHAETGGGSTADGSSGEASRATVTTPYPESEQPALKTAAADKVDVKFEFDDGVVGGASRELRPEGNCAAISFGFGAIERRPRYRRSVGVTNPKGGGDVVANVDTFDEVPQPARRQAASKLSGGTLNALQLIFAVA